MSGDHILNPNVQAVMNRSPEERIQFIIDTHKDWYIEHSAAGMITKCLMRTLASKPSTRNRHALVYGASHAGKTQMMNQALFAHYGTSDPISLLNSSPVLFIECTSNMDEPGFYREVLLKTNAPCNFRSPASVLKVAAIKIIRGLNKRIIIIDEFHNLLLTSESKRLDLLATLKYLSNDREMKTLFVLIGTYPAEQAIQLMPELSGRFQRLHAPPFKSGMEFQRFLKALNPYLPLEKPSVLHGQEIARTLLGMSEGLVGAVSLILADATTLAIESGVEEITLEILRSVDWVPLSERAAIAAQQMEEAAQ